MRVASETLTFLAENDALTALLDRSVGLIDGQTATVIGTAIDLTEPRFPPASFVLPSEAEAVLSELELGIAIGSLARLAGGLAGLFSYRPPNNAPASRPLHGSRPT